MLRLVNGTFRITGSASEGDRVRFYPDDPDALRAAGFAVRANSRGGIRLRLEGVDALESHYVPRGGRTGWHQAGDLCAAASASLLTALGFRRVEQDDSGVVRSSVPEQVPGYALTRFADAHGRLVGFAFAGRRRGRAGDGRPIHLDIKGLRDSVNWVLLRQGLGYPAFYTRLYPDLRAELTAAAEHARENDRGVWRRDLTEAGLRITDLDQLRSGTVLYPKVFRRLVDYLDLEGCGDGINLNGFPDYLQARGDELFTIPDGHVTHLDSLIEVRRNVLRMTVPVASIVFRER